MDRDTTPIGGLRSPMQPTRQLFYVTIVMDFIAILASFSVSVYFVMGVIAYILASRAYSYRRIRLKRFPVTGYLVVLIFQGALVFFISYHGISPYKTLEVPVTAMLSSSFLIGGYYPLTQVYQHEEDRADGVRTISMMMGKRGTFIFCGFMFMLATLCIFFTLSPREFMVFLACMLPVVWFFSFWMRNVWQDEKKADFKNSFRMNVLASVCTSICFIILAAIKHS